MKQINLIIMISFLAGCFGAEPQKTGMEGKILPEFSLLLIDSITRLNANDIPIGKPVVLFFFSPQCPYCKVETQMITENMDQLKNIQFYFITKYPLHYLKNFYKEFQLGKYPNITGGVDNSNTISDYFKVPGVPYLAIYGKDKKLNKTFLGKINTSQLKEVAEE